MKEEENAAQKQADGSGAAIGFIEDANKRLALTLFRDNEADELVIGKISGETIRVSKKEAEWLAAMITHQIRNW